MALTLFEPRRVRDILKAPGSVAVDLILLAFVAALVGAMVSFSHQVSAPYRQKVDISLSFWALPKYTFFSLARGFAAYGLSLIFTLIYGTIAAHNRRAERFMIPALDVLQSIPVLGFLPSLVLAMIAIFPTRELGLEIACVVMIFTAQVWNMTFSFYGSLRNIPHPLREVAKVNHLGWWRVFCILELPASMIGLVWNSMMSMAGGWFFLSVNEAFTLGDRDFRLPGIGSYMAEAINNDDWKAMVAAVVAMTIMIVLVDQVFWRPIVVWSERFKVEETADVDKAQSWVLNVLRHSGVGKWIVHRISESRKPPAAIVAPEGVTYARPAAGVRREKSDFWRIAQPFMAWLVVILLVLGILRGGYLLVRLLVQLPIHDPANHQDWTHLMLAVLASFARTTAAVLLGAVWCLPAGILIGRSPKWSQRLQPVVQVVASFPAPMLFPLVTILLITLHIHFGIGCVALMLLGAQWYILFNVIAGAMAIPSELKEVGSVYGTPALERWTRLYIPAVFPYLVTGLVTAAGGAWNATIVSEYVQVKGNTYIAFGLGSIISEATTSANYPLLAGAIVTMAVSVVVINRLMWKRLYRVAEDRYSLNV
jgi:NitT/TauT family transport system permease protein